MRVIILRDELDALAALVAGEALGDEALERAHRRLGGPAGEAARRRVAIEPAPGRVGRLLGDAGHGERHAS